MVEKIFEQPPGLEKEIKKEGISEIESRQTVIDRLKKGENLENLDLRGLDLAGLDFEKKSFQGSDLRGVVLYRTESREKGEEAEVKTNIRESDFTNAVFADFEGSDFYGVRAEKAKFGFRESLASRYKRHRENLEKTGQRPKAADTGGFFGFSGGNGDFMDTTWVNIDFGGNSGYEADFAGTDQSRAVFTGCNLSGIDFSHTRIDGIVIKDPYSLKGLIINKAQVDIIMNALGLSEVEEIEKLGLVIVEK